MQLTSGECISGVATPYISPETTTTHFVFWYKSDNYSYWLNSQYKSAVFEDSCWISSLNSAVPVDASKFPI